MIKIDATVRQTQRSWTHRVGNTPALPSASGLVHEALPGTSRSPVIVPDTHRVVVRYGDVLVASSRSAIRLIEPAGLAAFYLPPHDVARHLLRRVSGPSICEWKGSATFWSLYARDVVLERIAWSYESPVHRYADLEGYFSFDPGRLDCFVDGERLRARAGEITHAGSPMERWAQPTQGRLPADGGAQ